MSGLRSSLLGALLMAAVTTAGDYVWFELGVQHRMTAGVAHGAVLLLVLGLFLGARVRRPLPGALGGLGAGVFGALVYYALARPLGWGAMFVAWALLWVALAWLDGRVLARSRPTREWLARGVVAAVAGGLAFYAVSGVWTDHGPDPSYLWHFAAWTIAWWPGLAALLVERPR